MAIPNEASLAYQELGKVVFEKMSQQAVLLATERKTADQSWLSIIPHEILQAYQAVHGYTQTMADQRRAELKELQGPEKGNETFEEEAKNPGSAFFLVGLAPPINPIEVLLQAKIFVADWAAQYSEQKKREHLTALSLLSKIQTIEETYRVPEKMNDPQPELVN